MSSQENNALFQQIYSYGEITVILTTTAFSFFSMMLIILLLYFLEKKLPFIFFRTKLFNTCVDRGISPLKFFMEILMSDNRIIYKYLGLDSLIMMNSIRFFLSVCAVVLLFNLVCVVPTNVMANTSTTFSLQSFLTIISITNVPEKSSFLVLHFILLVGFTATIYIFMFLTWTSILEWKQQHFIDRSDISRTMLIQHLPEDLVEIEDLKNYISKYLWLDGKFFSILPLKNAFSLIKTLKEADYHLFKYISDSPRGSLVINPNDSKKNKYPNHLDDYYDTIAKLDDEEKNVTQSNVAILTFSHVNTSHTMNVTPMNTHMNSQRCFVAPEPLGIEWRNLIHSKYTRFTLNVLVWSATMLFTMFWTIPYGLIASLTKSPALLNQYDYFKDENHQFGIFVKTVVVSLLPLTILTVFYLILPYIMKMFSMMEGHVTKAATDLSIFTKFCIFHIINTFFVFMISGSLLQNISYIINEPLKIAQILANTIPMQANFYCMYVIFFAMVVHPYELLRVTDLIRYLVNRKTWNIRCKAIKFKPIQPDYAHMFSRVIYIFGIGIALSLMSPFLTILWTIYYCIVYCTYTYHEMYVRKCKYSYNGVYWILITDWVTVYTIIFQLLMLGMFTLKKMNNLSALTIPIPLITIVCHMLMRNMFCSRYLNMTLQTLKSIPEISKEEVNNIISKFDVLNTSRDIGSFSIFTIPPNYENIERSVIEKL